MEGGTVGTLKYDLTLDDSKLKSGLADSSKSVGNFSEQTKNAGDQIQGHMKAAAVALAGVAVGLTAYAKNATDFTVEQVKSAKGLATQLGITTTEASRLTAAFQRMGIDGDKTRQMFGVFEKQIYAATQTTESDRLAHEKLQIAYEKTQQEIAATNVQIQQHGDKSGVLALKIRDLNNTLATQKDQLDQTKNAFDRIGVSVVDANGKQKDFNTILFETADKFKEMPNGIDKTTLAMQLFGKSGKDMVKVLDLGSQGIQDLEKQADKLGLTLNPNTIAAVNGLVKAQKDLKQQTDAMKISVGTATAPVLTKWNEMLVKITQSMLNMPGPIHQATVDVLAFGGPVAGASSGLLGFVANLDQALPALKAVGTALAGMGEYLLILAAVALALTLIIHHFGGVHQTLMAMTPVLNFFKQAWWDIQVVFMMLWPIIVDIGNAFMTYVKPALEQVWQAVVRLWNALNPALMDALKIIGVLIAVTLIGAIVVFLGVLDVLAHVLGYVASAVANVIGWIANFIGWIGNAIGAVINFVGNFAGWIGSLPAHMASAVNGIRGAFNGAVNWLYGAGRDVIQGLINGIENMAGAVFRKVENIGSEAVKKLKGVLKIFSPSAVFHELGQFVGQGLANGIESMTGAVQDASGTLADAVISPSMNVLGGGGAGAMTPALVAGGGSTSNVTYRIGQVQLATAEAVDEFFSIGNRNVQLESAGGSPLAGTTKV